MKKVILLILTICLAMACVVGCSEFEASGSEMDTKQTKEVADKLATNQ